MRLCLALAAIVAGTLLAGRSHAAAFHVDYVVTVSRRDPGHVRVTWRLAGIDEIAGFRLVFRDQRTTDVTGSGRLQWEGRHLHWTPDAPYAHLSYRVAVDRRRPHDGARFDSHASARWIATRAMHLFPEINVDFRAGTDPATPVTRLWFDLPRGWDSVAVGTRIAPHGFRIREPGRRFDRPRGWLLLGRMTRRTRTIAGMVVTVAVADGAKLDPRALLRLYADAVPPLAEILGPVPPALLVVSAPDPMWHGGLSGEQSFFAHGHIPLTSSDETSTYLHELFHVWAPFTVAPDGHWVSEGLAEYYALAIPARTGRLPPERFRRGVEALVRAGRWNLDVARSADPAVRNNSAPAIMHALDRAIRDATAGRRSLDDAVRALVAMRAPVSTARWLTAVNDAAGRDFTPFFRRHVRDGKAPRVVP